jgi:hypothetical protein
LVRRFAVLSAVVVAALLTPSPAAAAAPCWKKLINDWYDNGRIDQVYALHCYRDALDQLPEDVETYSSLSEDIERALAAAIANRGSGGDGGNGARGGVKNGSRTVIDDDPEGTQRPDEGFFREAFDRVRPRNADSVPLPLMILGGLALLLVAAGAAGLIAKKVQARRVQLGVPGAPPDDEPGA